MLTDRNAVKLSRNPLGIIALFILLIYGFASILFAFSGSNFTNAQKWCFVVFLVAFPCIVLVIFTILVIFHHQKLYAPSEFKNEENFIGHISQKEKVKQSENENHSELAGSEVSTKKLSIDDRRKRHEAELKKAQTMENLVYYYYERKFDTEIDQNTYYKINENKIFFDGIMDKNDTLTFMKIKYLSDINYIPSYLFSKTVYDAVKVKQFLLERTKYQNYSFRLLLTFVVDTDDVTEITELRQKIQNELVTEMISIAVRILPVKQLEEK